MQRPSLSLPGFTSQRLSSLSVITSYSIHYTKLYDAKLGLQHFYNTISGIIEESECLSVSEIYDRVLKDTGYIKYLEIEDDKADVRIENIEELKNSIYEMEKEEESLTRNNFV